MKKVLALISLISFLLTLTLTPPAWAEDGAAIFSANCNACHMGGKNVVSAEKTLKKEALTKYLSDYDKDPLAAVVMQVTKGKNAMPAFGGRLTSEQIEAVASYVVAQSEKGW